MNYIYVVLGMAVVTYLPRMLPLTLLSRKTIPKSLSDFLEYIPGAVLSALLLPSILMVNGEISVGISNPISIAAILAFPIALKTKDMFITVLFGMVVMMILGKLL